jgi:hypothetical protein
MERRFNPSDPACSLVPHDSIKEGKVLVDTDMSQANTYTDMSQTNTHKRTHALIHTHTHTHTYTHTHIHTHAHTHTRQQLDHLQKRGYTELLSMNHTTSRAPGAQHRHAMGKCQLSHTPMVSTCSVSTSCPSNLTCARSQPRETPSDNAPPEGLPGARDSRGREARYLFDHFVEQLVAQPHGRAMLPKYSSQAFTAFVGKNNSCCV